MNGRTGQLPYLNLAAVTTILWFGATVPAAWAQQAGQTEREAMYYRYQNLHSLVTGGYVRPHRMVDGSSFWYVEQEGEETVIYRVDPVANTCQPFFDTQRLQSVLEATMGHELPGQGLPFTRFSFVDGERAAVFRVGSRAFLLQLNTYEIGDASPSEESRLTPHRSVTRYLGRTPEAQPMREALSPDRQWVATVRDHNVWVRPQDGSPDIRLTTDGIEDYEYTYCNDLGFIDRQFRGVRATIKE